VKNLCPRSNRRRQKIPPISLCISFRHDRPRRCTPHSPKQVKSAVECVHEVSIVFNSVARERHRVRRQMALRSETRHGPRSHVCSLQHCYSYGCAYQTSFPGRTTALISSNSTKKLLYVRGERSISIFIPLRIIKKEYYLPGM
jgi:hypothetical protein